MFCGVWAKLRSLRMLPGKVIQEKIKKIGGICKVTKQRRGGGSLYFRPEKKHVKQAKDFVVSIKSTNIFQSL